MWGARGGGVVRLGIFLGVRRVEASFDEFDCECLGCGDFYCGCG